MIKNMAEKIKWLGHASFRIESEKIIYIDPYELTDGPEADLIFITHSHYDHLSPGDIKKIAKKDTVFITEKSSSDKLDGDVRVMKPGDTITVGDINIKAVPAYNIGKKFHPVEKGWLGFLIEVEGVKIYHTGDTDFIPAMQDIKPDIALIPVSGTFVMTAEEAALAVEMLKPKIAIPMHFGSLVGEANDAVRFKNLLSGKTAVTILEKTK